MSGHIGNVQISHPGPTDESEGDEYWTTGLGSQLKVMYGELLGMVPIYIGYHKLTYEDGHLPDIGFEYSPDDVRPRWPDPAFPQQMHLDIEVADLDVAARLVASHGARQLDVDDTRSVFEDGAGHPFCLYQGATGAAHGRIARIVFDCFSPRSLARFYEVLFDMEARTVDRPERVEIAGGGHDVVLAFQQSSAQAPRWPDPNHPPQLHLDVGFEDPTKAELIEDLGGIRLILDRRPDNTVYADPAGHTMCFSIGPRGSRVGTAQVLDYNDWLTSQSRE
jgi:hypothetical protein